MTEEESGERLYDVVVWGASGFTGSLVAQYMAQHAPEELKWAIGGRDKGELENVKKIIQKLTGRHEDLAIILGNNEIQKSMEHVAKQTRVVLSTAGPFTRIGTNLVEACVRYKTDYCDISGEITWVRGLIDQFHDEAQQNGVRIVNMCGFDSVPADLGALYLVNYIKENYNQNVRKIRGIVNFKEKQLSGGTVNSLLAMIEDWKSFNEARHPYYLNDGDYRAIEYSYEDKEQVLPRYDAVARTWTGPFLPFSMLNTRVVRRSQSLMRKKYGNKFRYNEAHKYTSLVFAVFATLFTMFMFLLLMIPFIRRRIIPKLAPPPGSGPSDEERRRAWFEYQLVAELETPGVNGAPSHLIAIVKGGDPAYTETSKFVAESAICLAMDGKSKNDEKRRAGVLTPASCFGMKLVKRLQEKNVTFEIMEENISSSSSTSRPGKEKKAL